MKMGSTGCGGWDDMTIVVSRKGNEGGLFVSDCDLVINEVALICLCQLS